MGAGKAVWADAERVAEAVVLCLADEITDRVVAAHAGPYLGLARKSSGLHSGGGDVGC